MTQKKECLTGITKMTREEKLKFLSEYDDNLIKNLVPFIHAKNEVYLDLSEEVFDKIKEYCNPWYVINSKKNAIKFTYNSPTREPIVIIVEWNSLISGKLIYCTFTEDIEEDNLIEMNIDERKINGLTDILTVFKYFKEPYISKRLDKTEGPTMSLEVQLGNNYEEIVDISPSSGVILEMGKKLLKYSRARLKEKIF